jgi:sugar phosphate permease
MMRTKYKRGGFLSIWEVSSQRAPATTTTMVLSFLYLGSIFSPNSWVSKYYVPKSWSESDDGGGRAGGLC